MNNPIAVILTAAAGDGTKQVCTGYVTEDQEMDLQIISSMYPAYIETALYDFECDCKPSGRNLVEDVKFWMVSADDKKYDEIKNLPIHEFCRHAYVTEELWA